MAARGDRFVLRFYSPMRVLGGGVVLDPAASKHKRSEADLVNRLQRALEGNPEEIALDALIASGTGLIRPQVVCTLGRIAAQGLLGRDFKITQERGKWLSFAEIPLMSTFYPAYLLRNPSAKRQVWEDVQEIMKHLGLEVKGH